MNNFTDYTEEERILHDVIISARKVQDFIWDGDNILDYDLKDKVWVRVFQKRVDKISEIDFTRDRSVFELKKRVLQQAALSIILLKKL